MADINITFWTQGEHSLDEDYITFTKVFGQAIINAIDQVSAKMTDALKSRIDLDVYAAYSPTVYSRRKDNPSLGIPLNDMDKNVRVITGGHVGAKGIDATMRIYYNPTGQHENAEWSNVDYDELIGRIEHHSPEYEWLPKKTTLPDRPFWQNFVDEMIDGKEVERYFVDAIKNEGFGELIADGGIKRDSNDGKY